MTKPDKATWALWALWAVISLLVAFSIGHWSGHRHACQMWGFDRYDVEKRACASDGTTTEYEPPVAKATAKGNPR